MLASFIPPAASGSGEGRGGLGALDTDIRSFEFGGDLEIVNGFAVTHTREILLIVTFVGNPTHYQVCEDSHLRVADCELKRLPFDGRIRYKLSDGSGLKKIYFRARYLGTPGEVYMARINYLPQ